MKYPQTLAGELYKLFPCEQLKNIYDNACLAIVAMWCLGIEEDDIKVIMDVQQMINAKVIEPDCTVLWYKIVPYLTGRELESLEKQKITSLKGIVKRTPVLMAKEGNAEGIGHWVGVEKGKIRCNPKKYSVNVEEGKPVEARIMTISGVGKA